MATVFITISRGSIARNILGTDAFRILGERGVRRVILTRAWKDQHFRETFGGEGIAFEPLHEVRWTAADRFFVGIHKGLVYNAGSALRDRFGIYDGGGNALKWMLKQAAFSPLCRIGALKDAARRLDGALIPDWSYQDLFARERPSLLFATNPLEDSDVAVMKAARSAGVRIVAMHKSWDNLPKMSFRVKPDVFLVWGSALVEQAVRYQRMKREEVRVVGIPQFDIYHEPGVILSREEFFRRIGADPGRKLIVFGSDGKSAPNDPDVAEIIADFVGRDALGSPAQLYLRPYFALRGEERKFERLAGRPSVIIDRWFVPREIFRDRWDYSREHAIHFANLVAHADVMICTASTLTLDAAYRDKQVVNIAFDGRERKPYGRSVARYYDSAHYAPIARSGGCWVVQSADELREALTSYLARPDLHREGRAWLRQEYCCRTDGQSGRRVADALLSELERVQTP